MSQSQSRLGPRLGSPSRSAKLKHEVAGVLERDKNAASREAKKEEERASVVRMLTEQLKDKETLVSLMPPPPMSAAE